MITATIDNTTVTIEEVEGGILCTFDMPFDKNMKPRKFIKTRDIPANIKRLLEKKKFADFDSIDTVPEEEPVRVVRKLKRKVKRNAH